MSDNLSQDEIQYDVRRIIEPYLQIAGFSESGDSLFVQGYWRDDDAHETLEQQLKQSGKSWSATVQRTGDKGLIRIGLNGQAEQQPKYWLHGLLLFLTILTTLFAGTLMAGEMPWPDVTKLVHGVPFSATLLLILGTHELGHYITAKRYNVDATLPYFIPAPTFIGTFGAFIKMKSPILDKRALLDIGAAGPIAGFIVTVPALFIGLQMSTVVDTTGVQGSIQLGDSLFMMLATDLVFPNLPSSQDVMLHPVAFAGWIGLLVTALNLLPIGQLDGGHIAYAMFGGKHKWIAWIAFAALIPLSFLSLNWLIWAVLILVLIRVQHPPIMAPEEPLPLKQKIIGWVTIAILIGSFIPEPISM
ncbi:MAG: site-2 protease family protein [Candidatus Marinimicrobia bacterium]|nr:site-2 protease family protein [Candidatus Neomarinimicrobiota bacterium]MCF7828897.1 site-2 protease family protein [Candidatus Neomarinimicrobiota bacterium]MCF7879857.1 site-2 protease family protein [Candidatus Neomarinimicrobiota bacterium]